MPSERAISQMVDVFTDVIDLGGTEERTAIVPNLSVIDAAPTGLTNFIIVQDDRDGDNILAKTVPGVVYTNSDKVNVLFIRGAEPIAFQQGSESANAGLWEIVPGTSTDIFYDKGNVGIGSSTPSELLQVESSTADKARIKIVETGDTTSAHFSGLSFFDGAVFKGGIFKKGDDHAIQIFADAGAVITVDQSDSVGVGTAGPDAKLDVLATTTQLRLTHTDGSKFADFTLDTNHDLTIKPSSTGQIKLQPTTDSTDFFQVLDADGGEPSFQVNTTDETASIATSDISFQAGVSTVKTGLFIESPDQANFHGFTLRKISNTAGRFTVVDFLRARVGPGAVVDGDDIGAFQFFAHDGTDYNRSVGIQAKIDGAVSANTVPGALLFQTTTTNSLTERMRIAPNGDVSIGNVATPLAQLHIDQPSTTGAQPVAYFDQADISEEMFQFATTIGVGNAIEAVGAKTLTTTHFIKVTIPGGLTRYFPVGTIA